MKDQLHVVVMQMQQMKKENSVMKKWLNSGRLYLNLQFEELMISLQNTASIAYLLCVSKLMLFYILVPVKFEHVVFCKLAPLQQSLYDVFLTSPEIQKILRGQGSQPLKAITILKKLCNHPNLLNLPTDLDGCEKFLPAGYSTSQKVDPSYSGKFVVLARYGYNNHWILSSH